LAKAYFARLELEEDAKDKEYLKQPGSLSEAYDISGYGQQFARPSGRGLVLL
jgi:hypothetical protein